MKLKFLSFLLVLLPFSLMAQTKVPPLRAKISVPEAHVFKQPSFDADVIAQLSEGQVFEISTRKFQSFYRIRIKPGLLGYISEEDIKIISKASPKSSTELKQSKDPKSGLKSVTKPMAKEVTQEVSKASSQNPAKIRPFSSTKYVGLQYNQIQFREDSMGDQRQESLGFLGVKLTGPDLLIEGAFPTEINFQYHSGAPAYYEKLTGLPVDGWAFLMDFRFLSQFPQSRNLMTFFGFGPMLRYSKFNVSLQDASSGKITDYSLEDMAVGALFNTGLAVRLGGAALRAEIQYHWEKLTYFGGGLSLQFAF